MAKLSNNQHYEKSLKHKTMVRIITNHPDGDFYDGIVIALSLKFVVIQEVRDIVVGGIVILPKSSIKKLRVGKFEATQDQILRHSQLIRKIKKRKWLRDQKTLRDVLAQFRSRKVWPIIEAWDEKNSDTYLYIGPIVDISPKKFSIDCYDANAEWEDEYLLEYSQIFRIEFEDPYSTHFNNYMRSLDE